MNEGRLDSAQELFLSFLNDHPECATAYLQLGILHEQLGQHDSARVYADRGWRVNPEDERIAYLRYQICLALGQSLKAEIVYKDLIKLNPAIQQQIGRKEIQP
jgi:tetratricopeptide (TPR) repeat protein